MDCLCWLQSSGSGSGIFESTQYRFGARSEDDSPLLSTG